MNSLVNYASDGDNSSDSDEALVPNTVTKSSISRRSSDAIYDPVPMDMSEESNNNHSSEDSNSPRNFAALRSHPTESTKNLPSHSDQRRNNHDERSSNSRNDHKSDEKKTDRIEKNERRHALDKKSDEKRRGNDHKDYKDLKRHRDDDRKSRDEEKKPRNDDRKSRDSEKRKDKSSKEDKIDEKNDHHRDDRRDRDKRDEKSRRRDRDRNRERDEAKDRNRERSREKDRERERGRDWRHGREEKSRDRHREDRRSKDKDRERSRSGSRSRERKPFSFRDEMRNKNKLAQLEKLGIELKPIEENANPDGKSFYNPLATATQGKYAEQIQKRKLLWASKKEEAKTTASTPASTWVGTTFTHDQDGKVTAKFKRLMGIKEEQTPAPGAKPDILKKQEEMFNNMEQQYEVARATTHTQRGVGLGYASGSYPFPR